MNQLGGYLIAQEDFDEAAKIYEELLNLPGRQLEAYLGLAKVASAEGDLPAASTYLANWPVRQPLMMAGPTSRRAAGWQSWSSMKRPTSGCVKQSSGDLISLGYAITYADNARRAGAYGTSVERYQQCPGPLAE